MKHVSESESRQVGSLVRRMADQGGSALMAAFWMMVVLLLAGMAASFSTTTEITIAGNDRVDSQLFYLAEAGVAEVKKYLDGLGIQFEGTGDTKSAPRQVFLERPISAGGDVRGVFTAYVDKQEHLNGKPTKFLAITVRAWIQGNPRSKVVQEMVGQDNFAKFAYFTDNEQSSSGSTVWFATGDILRGPVHSNSQFNINGDPFFFKEVTTTASSINYAGGSNNPTFMEGVVFDVDPVPLPTDTSLLEVKSMEPDGLYFAGATSLELQWDPITEYAHVLVDQGAGVVDYQLPENGVLYVDGVCRLKGTLKGQLTIASSSHIYLDDDVLYAEDPRIIPQSTDLLGLVAEGNIYVATTAANLDAGDETFMAVMMALGTSFTAQNYASGTPRGTLRVIGGIIQDRRGPVGTFNSGGIVSGYSKDYLYDVRLADSPPPAFPTTGRIITLAWKELDPNYDISSNVF